MSKKHKRELEDLQATVKYHNLYHTKKAKTENDGEIIFPAKESEEKKKRTISKNISDLL